MLILTDCELNQFAIRKLQKEIEQQLKEWRDEEILKKRLQVVTTAWGELVRTCDYDCDKLWALKYDLEMQVFRVNI